MPERAWVAQLSARDRNCERRAAVRQRRRKMQTYPPFVAADARPLSTRQRLEGCAESWVAPDGQTFVRLADRRRDTCRPGIRRRDNRHATAGWYRHRRAEGEWGDPSANSDRSSDRIEARRARVR